MKKLTLILVLALSLGGSQASADSSWFDAGFTWEQSWAPDAGVTWE